MIRQQLLDVIEKVRLPASEASGLPNISYTDPELFSFERNHVLGASWAAVCYGSDLSQPGYAKPIDFMGLPLLVIRDRQGNLKVFHNVCRHRGMKLVSDAAPLRSVIRCPYHSWSYNLDGALVSTPHVGGCDIHSCDGFDKSDYGLVPVRFGVWMDIVFVNLSGDAESFEDYLAPLTERWQPYLGANGIASLELPATGHRMELEINCNWKLPVENYCESYHLPWVHPSLNEYSPLDKHYNILVGDVMSGQGSLNYTPTMDVSEQLPQFAEWPQERLKHAEYISLYPNTLLGIQADHAFALIVQPLSESSTLERVQLYFIGDGASENRYAGCRKAVLDNWKSVFDEDIFAVEGMQRGRASPGFDGGVFTPVQDVPTHHFHKWVADRYAKNLA